MVSVLQPQRLALADLERTVQHEAPAVGFVLHKPLTIVRVDGDDVPASRRSAVLEPVGKGFGVVLREAGRYRVDQARRVVVAYGTGSW